MIICSSCSLKRISEGLLVIFIWTFCLFETLHAIADVRKTEASSQKVNSGQDVTKKPTPGEKFQTAISEVEKLLADRITDADKKIKLKAKKNEIIGLALELRKSFREVEGKIAGLSEVVQSRHKSFVLRYDGNLQELFENIDEIQKHEARSKELEDAITKAKVFLAR